MLVESGTCLFQVELHGVGHADFRGLIKARRGIYVAAGAYGHEEIAALKGLIDLIHVQGHLTEPDDMGAQVSSRAATAALGVKHEIFTNIEDKLRVPATHLEDLTVHVQEIFTAGAFV